MSSRFAGLDVHCKKVFWCVQDEEGEVLFEEECVTSPEEIGAMVRRFDLPPMTRIGLESGGQARWICHVLEKAGMAPEVLSPQEIRAKVHRRGQKTDRRDAFEICDGLRRDQFVSRVWMPSEAICRLRLALSRRRHFISIRTAQINAAKGLLKTLPQAYRSIFLGGEKGWSQLLAQHEDSPLRPLFEAHQEMWALARGQAGSMDEEVREALVPFKEIADLLQTAPGVGPVTAATFIATVGDPRRFASSAQLASYVGLAPSVYDSGQTERHGPITKQGSGALRTALCEAAQQARRPNNPLNPYYLRVKSRSGHKKAMVAVAHRLLRIMYQMWKNKEEFDYKKLNVRFEPKTQSWTSYFQIGKNQAA